MNWRDITSYKQGDKLREVRSVATKVGKLELTVTRHIHHPPNQWLASCLPFFELTMVGNGSLEDAKDYALERLYEDICDVTDAMEAAREP